MKEIISPNSDGKENDKTKKQNEERRDDIKYNFSRLNSENNIIIDYGDSKDVKKLDDSLTPVGVPLGETLRYECGFTEAMSMSLEEQLDSFRAICKIGKERGDLTVQDIDKIYIESSMMMAPFSKRFRDKLPKEWFDGDSGMLKRKYANFFKGNFSELAKISRAELNE